MCLISPFPFYNCVKYLFAVNQNSGFVYLRFYTLLLCFAIVTVIRPTLWKVSRTILVAQWLILWVRRYLVRFPVRPVCKLNFSKLILVCVSGAELCSILWGHSTRSSLVWDIEISSHVVFLYLSFDIDFQVICYKLMIHKCG